MKTPKSATTAVWPKGGIPNTITLDDGRRVICRIFDAGEDMADRYTVAFKGYRDNARRRMVFPYLASGPTPFHPQGFGQHGESDTFLTGKHLGKRVTFASVPADAQKFILQQFAR